MHIISLKLEQEANFFGQSIAYNDISEWGQRRHRVANEQLQVSASAHYFRLAVSCFMAGLCRKYWITTRSHLPII